MIDLRAALLGSWNRRTKEGARLRVYEVGDLEAMYQLDQVCFEPQFRFDRAAMRKFAEAPNALVAIADGEEEGLWGFAIVHLEDGLEERYGYVVTLDVAPARRGQGLAGRLLGALEERAKEAGARWMGLHVSSENAGAIRFYERMEYGGAERRVEFYGAGMDGWEYWKRLG